MRVQDKPKAWPGKNEFQWKYFSLAVPPGLITLYFQREGIYCLLLEQKGFPLERPRAGRAASLPWPELERELQGYFRGREISGDYPLIDQGYSTWTQRVLQLTKSIPYGQTLTYKELAEKAGVPGGARAVGQALSRNRTPLLIPCHRVIGQKGKLIGFSSGLAWKERLLKLEGVVFS